MAITLNAAAHGYNQLVFEGRLAEDPALRQAGTGRLYCRVAVLQDQPDRNGQPGAQAVDVVCFDERATRFAERFRRGDHAIFIGRMTIERRGDQKGHYTNVSLHLERVLGHRPVAEMSDATRGDDRDDYASQSRHRDREGGRRAPL